jgi:hypothetical protein
MSRHRAPCTQGGGYIPRSNRQDINKAQGHSAHLSSLFGTIAPLRRAEGVGAQVSISVAVEGPWPCECACPSEQQAGLVVTTGEGIGARRGRVSSEFIAQRIPLKVKALSLERSPDRRAEGPETPLPPARKVWEWSQTVGQSCSEGIVPAFTSQAPQPAPRPERAGGSPTSRSRRVLSSDP